jgi:Phosphatidylinositol transfer protein
MPSIVVGVVPSSALYLIEEAWNAYPYCRTVLVNGYLSVDRFKIDIESLHTDISDRQVEDDDNPLKISAEEIKQRKVEYLDIRNANIDPKSKTYNADMDSTKYVSKETKRGPLKAGWEHDLNLKPRMCAYKLVRADFKYFPLQSKVEGITISTQRELFTRTLNQVYVSIDEWCKLSMGDIRKLEGEAAAKSAALLQSAAASKKNDPITFDPEYHLKRLRNVDLSSLSLKEKPEETTAEEEEEKEPSDDNEIALAIQRKASEKGIVSESD